MIQTTTSDITYKKEMTIGSYGHSCAKISGPNDENLIVVAGGKDENGVGTSTQIYSVSEDSWNPGSQFFYWSVPTSYLFVQLLMFFRSKSTI